MFIVRTGPLRPPLILTDDEDLCRLIPTCLWLGGRHFVDELLEDPQTWLTVFRAENLGEKTCQLLSGTHRPVLTVSHVDVIVVKM